MQFAYPLQKIVDLKTNEKKQAESLLSDAIAVLNEEERKRDELLQAKRQQQERMAGTAGGSAAVTELVLFQQYIDHLDAQLLQSAQRIRQAQRNAEQTRQQLTDCMVDEKVWIKAREKAKSIHMANVEKAIQNQLDDMTTARRRNA